ncbi:Fc.00g007160.m01.CDS01 [Cosmosporella sp. VM-42]
MWKPKHILWPRPYTKTEPLYYPRDLLSPPAQYLPLATTLKPCDITPQPECPLLRLPREIRDKIWHSATETYCDPDQPYLPNELHWRPNTTGPYRCDTELLRTCRAIYAETWDLPLKQTPLIVFEGSEEDRGKWHYPTSTKPGMLLFCLQAWQLLLIRRVEMTFQQIRIDGGGINEWLGKIGEARALAKGIVTSLVDDDEAKKVAVQGILGSLVKEVSVRLNRRDWWTWSSEPTDPDLLAEAEASGTSPASGPAPAPGSTPARKEELSLKLIFPPGWGETTGIFSPDFTFSLILETFGVKRNQLEKVVSQAKRWKLQRPRLEDGTIGREMMVWDEKEVDGSFEMKRMERMSWLKQHPWKRLARRIEVRTVRYVRETAKVGAVAAFETPPIAFS